MSEENEFKSLPDLVLPFTSSVLSVSTALQGQQGEGGWEGCASWWPAEGGI